MPASLLPILSQPGQPGVFFDALAERLKDSVGYRLFTLLYVDGDEVARIYSSNPDAYPVSGRKHMGPTPWGDHVLKGQKPWLGMDMDAIRWAFFDHELIASLGLGCCINIPVIYDAEVIGTIALLDVEHRYTEDHLAAALPFAPLTIPAYLAARFAAQTA